MRASLIIIASLVLLPAAFGQIVPIDCSVPVDGSFAQPEGDTYSFQAHAGDSVTIRLLYATDRNFVPVVALASAGRALRARPSGAVTNGVTMAVDYDLPYEGGYQLSITNKNQTPSAQYKLVFTFLNRPCSGDGLACGTGRQDQITSPMQIKSYQFQASAGDVLSARFTKLAPFTTVPATATSKAISFTPVLAVFGPTGQLMTTAAGQRVVTASSRIDFTAPVSGPLTVLIVDSNNLSGNYVLSITTLNRPCGAGSLECGKVQQSNITGPLVVDTYSMDMLAGDFGSIRTANLVSGDSFVPAVELYDPAGAPVALSIGTLPSNRVAVTFNFTVKVSGKYTALVRDSSTGIATGSYALTLVRLNRPCSSEALSCSSFANGSIGGLLGTRLYTVPALAKDVFLLRVLHNDQQAAFRPRLDVYGPQGNSVASFTVTDLGRQTFTANTDGQYTIVVSDGNDAAQTGSYNLAVQRLNRPCGATALSCGAIASGSLAAFATGAYSYNAAPGESFTLRMIDPSGVLQPAVEVYDPQGSLVGQTLSGNFAGVDVAQPAGGAYTILALDNNRRPAGGPFGLALFRTVNPCSSAAPQGQTLTGVVSSSAPFLSYSIPAAAGDALLLRSASSTPGFAAQMDLYDPTGARVDSQTFSISRSATAAGNYTVIVGPSAPKSGGAYAFAWQALNRPAAAPPLQCGGSTTASLTTGNPFRYYTVNAASGDVLRLLLTKVSDNFSPRVDLYDPSGALVTSSLDVTQKAKADGNYLALVSPSSATGENGSYMLAFQRPNNPCSPKLLTCGQSTLQQVNIPGQLDTLAFTGSAGDRANLKLAQRSGGYTPFVELYDPAGTRVGTSSSGSMIASLASTGSYSVLVRDTGATTLGSYRASLQNDASPCKVDDTEAPSLTLLQPTGGEVIGGGTAYLVQWMSDDNVAVATHDVALSVDGGKTFSTPIAAGLNGNAQSFAWQAPPDIAPTRTAVVRVTATDAAGNARTVVSAPLTIIGAGFTPNNTVTFSYDPLNRLVQAALGDGRTVAYTWDMAGNLVGVAIAQ